jgi:cell wall-associated NlpC family hydrolase
MNGIELNRNASEQVRQGAEVPLDPEFSKLKKGDLLFFGWARSYDGPEWITHVAIYLGNKSFIQSSEMVRISSLDPSAPNYDEHHSRALLYARRILKDR